MKQFLRARWQHWLDQRLPASQQITLSHRSIFILPSGFGVLWLALVVLLYLFGTNYQNNLVIGLSILLLSLFITSILYAYKNLSGLGLKALTPPDAYANETLALPISVKSNHPCLMLRLHFKNAIKQGNTNVNNAAVKLNTAQRMHIAIKLVDNNERTALVPFPAQSRGIFKPKRLTVSSTFPLGLCRAWSHVDLAIEQLIYPSPIESAHQLALSQQSRASMPQWGKQISGIDEFKGLRPHVLGESLKQVAWKQWAQGRGMLTKEFERPQGSPVWLTLTPPTKWVANAITPQEIQAQEQVELHLSQLCWQVNKLAQAGQYFGLKLHFPPIHRAALQTSLTDQSIVILSPDTGVAHKTACLQALARYPGPPSVTLKSPKDDR